MTAHLLALLLAASEPTPAPTVEAAPPPAPAALAAPERPMVRPLLDLFADYAWRDTLSDQAGWNHQFDVPRVWAGVEGGLGPVRGRAVLEAVRSAGEGALIGVGGDSLLLRVREAWAGWTPVEGLEASLGVVPTLAVPELDAAWASRPLASSLEEQAGLLSPADLGATARYVLPRGLGWAGLSLTDGEGYAQRELNRGKDLALAAELRPLALMGLAPLAVFASFEDGSQGTARVHTDRLTTSVLWLGERARAGAVATLAWGVDGYAARAERTWTAFAHVEPWGRLLLAARLGLWQRQPGPGDDQVASALAAVGYRPADMLELYLSGARVEPGAGAQSALPGERAWEARLTAHLSL